MDKPLLQILIIAATSRLRTSLQAVVASLPLVHRVYIAADAATTTQTLTTTSIDVVLLAGDLPYAVQRQILRDLQHSSPAVTIILFGDTAGCGNRRGRLESRRCCRPTARQRYSPAR